MATAQEATSNDIAAYEPDDTDIEDLIPDELKAAIEKSDLEEKEPEKKKVSQVGTATKAPEPEPDEEEDEDDYDINKFYDDEDEEDDDDLDMSPEAVDRLIEGDPDALRKKKAEPIEDEPFWHNNEDYAELVKTASYAGFDQQALDKVIQAASDSKVIETGNYVNGLKTKLGEYENSHNMLVEELKRLKNIEKSAYFDNSEEAKTRYTIPLKETESDLKELLEYEGSELEPTEVFSASNRAALNSILADHDLEDASRLKIVNAWKSHRELTSQREEDRKLAKEDLSKSLSTGLPEDVAFKVLQNSLTEFMESAPEYDYIKRGVLDGLNNNPKAAGVVKLAKSNFLNLVKAFGNPGDYVHNNQWRSGLAKFMFDAAHNRTMAQEYTQQQSTYRDMQERFVKLAKKHKQLLKSGKGITGAKGSARAESSKSGKIAKDDAEEFKNLLSGKLDISDILL
jgi:hypothetical protein